VSNLLYPSRAEYAVLVVNGEPYPDYVETVDEHVDDTIVFTLIGSRMQEIKSDGSCFLNHPGFFWYDLGTFVSCFVFTHKVSARHPTRNERVR
jgi:hypothetical protein